MKKQQITAFYLEALLLIVVFVGIILVLTSIFGLSKARSSDAKLLTNAVSLAQNTAEAVSAADSPEALLALLDEGNAELVDADGQTSVCARYDADMTPDPAGAMRVEATWQPEEGAAGTLVSSTIRVLCEGTEPVYTLDTAIFLPEVTE